MAFFQFLRIDLDLSDVIAVEIRVVFKDFSNRHRAHVLQCFCLISV